MMELGRAVSQVCWAWVLSRRIRQKTAPTPSSSNAGAGAGTPAAAGKGPQKSSQPPALSKAQTALQGVQQLSPSALWKGMCKVRLKKAGQASTDLEQFQATLVEESTEREDCARVLSQLSAYIGSAARSQDVIGKLRSKKRYLTTFVMQTFKRILPQCAMAKAWRQTLSL